VGDEKSQRDADEKLLKKEEDDKRGGEEFAYMARLIAPTEWASVVDFFLATLPQSLSSSNGSNE
jgi:hypothetical protein